ncbi:hypothetical protein EG328_006018 [Venturia inaequalis]|uniref:FMN hydroxy acid dehydrogenase domain-containing protein n=1 Tax=Venturia inaequalis TaxID=5025 RepID=A0A8H3YT00_VENIN|nr:hypothetical protein EG327_011012 [Venturia inaequalis]KAE9970838.1 hypothetical protein EG328_006018 [Venturia inaequalis]
MQFTTLLLSAAGTALAARPFLGEPDTGIDEALGVYAANKTLPPLSKIVSLPDFDWAARQVMNTSSYTYYRNGAGGEWSYRNNLEAFSRFRLRPRTLVDITGIESTLNTTILGHNFSAPFFISPAARAGYGNEKGEIGLVEGAAQGNILYMAALYATLTIEEIAAAKKNSSQVTFQQVYLDNNDTATRAIFQRAEKAGSKAIIFTVDSAADGVRHRAARYGVGSADTTYSYITWEYYRKLQKMTTLPIIIKGIMTVEDAKLAVQNGAPAIILSNHGGRQLDGSPSSIEVALEIHTQAPEVFKKIEVYADGGVRYGVDVLRLLALGVRAVGLGRPFMYANVYGTAGVVRAIELLKREVALDAANLGVADLGRIDGSFVKWDGGVVNGWMQ